MDGPISKEHRSLNPVASCTAMPFETSKANAALIVAAAPQMFDCLVGALDQITLWGNGDGPLAEEIRAAIAKATGSEGGQHE
jgi:hypothetical protein